MIYGKTQVALAVLAPPLRAHNGHEDISNTQIERSVEGRHHHYFSKKYLKVFCGGGAGGGRFFSKKAVSPCIIYISINTNLQKNRERSLERSHFLSHSSIDSNLSLALKISEIHQMPARATTV